MSLSQLSMSYKIACSIPRILFNSKNSINLCLAEFFIPYCNKYVIINRFSLNVIRKSSQ